MKKETQLEFKGKIKDFYSPTYDCVFKYLFGYNGNIIFTENLLEALLDLKEGSLRNKIKIINSLKLNKEHIMDKNYEVDILVELPDKNIINLEVYRGFNEASKIKSLVYLSHLLGNYLKSGEEYSSIKKYQQFNIVKNAEGKLRSYIEYKISDTNLHEEYLPDVFKINVIRVDKVDNKLYNISDRLKGWLLFLNSETYEEAKKIGKGDKILMEALKSLKKFFSKKENNQVYDKEVYYKMYANENLKLGRKEEKINITKNLLSKNIDSSIISETTGLSISEINKLKAEL